MTSDAPTSVGKHITLKVACTHSQWYTQDLVFWLADMTRIMTLHNFPQNLRPNVISDGPSNGMSIRLLCSLHHGASRLDYLPLRVVWWEGKVMVGDFLQAHRGHRVGTRHLPLDHLVPRVQHGHQLSTQHPGHGTHSIIHWA